MTQNQNDNKHRERRQSAWTEPGFARRSPSREGSGTLSGFPRRDSSAGFTLLEIMIVLAIIALIAGGVGTAVFRSFNNAKKQAAKLRLKAVRDATAQYMIDNNSSCPKGVDDLVAQKYLDRNMAKDPWDKPFLYRCPGTNDPDSADVSSSGPDKQEGTPDDIKSWEL